MADTSKSSLTWPTGSWVILKRIIRAWYAAENSGDEWTQRTVSKLANVQPSRVSANKPFLQATGIIQSEGIELTDAGKTLGLGLYSNKDRVTQQALQKIVRDNSILKQLLSIVRGRGTIDEDGFEAEILLLTKQGPDTLGFSAGVGVLEDMLLESGLVEKSGNTLRPTTAELNSSDEVPPPPKKEDEPPPRNGRQFESKKPGLRQIPIPVSAATIWYIEVGENPEAGEIDRFIEMQRLIFGVQKP
jgi:hypothetical protein